MKNEVGEKFYPQFDDAFQKHLAALSLLLLIMVMTVVSLFCSSFIVDGSFIAFFIDFIHRSHSCVET